MLLTLDDFSAFFANWDDKATNLRRIASALNIGTDSLVFFDDNPAERALIRQRLPEVTVIDVPEDPAYYVRALDAADPFARSSLTREDVGRADAYLADAQRETLLTHAADYGAYLDSLGMTGGALPLTAAGLARFTQLLNRTNQCNLRTRRFSEAETAAMLQDPARWRLIAVTLSDRFSDYGMIGCAALEKRGTDCFLDSFVMSCRVLKRGVEDMAFSAILRAARDWGSATLSGEYLPTKKNGMTARLLDGFGMARTAALPGGGTAYTATLDALTAHTRAYPITEKEQAWT